LRFVLGLGRPSLRQRDQRSSVSSSETLA
jgi:hypothetical protein